MSKAGHLILLLATLAPCAALLSGSPAAAALGARVLRRGPAARSTLRQGPESSEICMGSGSIIVFGATGACGSAVCNALLERDPATRVYAFVRDDTAARAVLPPQVELIMGDMSDASAVADAMARSRAKSVFLACRNGKQQVRNEQNVIAAAEDSGAESVVKLSTASQCLSADSAVGQAHLAVEATLKGSSIKSIAILRANYFMQNLLKPGLVVGNGHDPRLVRSTGVLKSHYAKSKISMVDVRDVAQVAAALLLAEGGGRHAGVRELDITGPEALTMNDVAAQMQRQWGTPVRCEEVSLDEALEQQEGAGVMSSTAAKSLQNFLLCIGQECHVIVTESVEQIARVKSTPLAQFLTDYAHAF